MGNEPRESGISAARRPSSFKSFISVIDNEVPATDKQSRIWGNPLDCSAKSTARVKNDDQRILKLIIKNRKNEQLLMIFMFFQKS